jgi:hypothetical protein
MDHLQATVVAADGLTDLLREADRERLVRQARRQSSDGHTASSARAIGALRSMIRPGSWARSRPRQPECC